MLTEQNMVAVAPIRLAAWSLSHSGEAGNVRNAFFRDWELDAAVSSLVGGGWLLKFVDSKL